MGDAQSAQRDGNGEAAEEEQSVVKDAPTEDDKLIKNNGQISEINKKPDGTKAGVNGNCEDQIAQKAIILHNKATSATEPKEIEDAQMIEKYLREVNEEEEIINMDVKQNDINESFRRLFSNIGLKLTVKRGSAETEDETEKEEEDKLEAAEETASKTKYEDIEQNTNVIQDNDSTTCPTLTDVTSEDVSAEMAEQKTYNDDAHQTKDSPLEDSNPDEEIVSPIKRFFTTGIFSSLQKKKKNEEDTEKELDDMSKKDEANEKHTVETNSKVDTQQEENQSKNVPEVAQTTQSTEAMVKSPSTDHESEPEITSSQEKELFQGSPFKRMLSGSFKRRSKAQTGRRSSDAKLSDSGEHISEHTEASTESAAEQQVVAKVVESPHTPSPPSTAEEPQKELSTWETFKKLMTPKRSLKRPSVSIEEVQVPAPVDEQKSGEGEHVSDHSTEEGKKRKDSSHSWEAVLCGSGRRRSRKTSDSEDEHKQDAGHVDSPNEANVVTSTPKQAGSPSDSESSTWKSLKKLVTPKRKAKEEDESKYIVQSDSETTQEESVFSIKKLLPGRKKQQSGDKPDQLSSDEAEKELASMEEDSETPAVVPLSEFDKSETEAVLPTDVESQARENKFIYLIDESKEEEMLDIPKTFVQEVQKHQVTPIVTSLNQEQDEFSKYQQLSDIPEEGLITETMATSFTEEVAKDDIADNTIAEDMVEITSEAITAPEPVDITMADETDELMLSAVSQLSESSKTSVNTTPVPAEYDMKETEILLKQVVETISTSPKADTVSSEEQGLERVVGMVSRQILERSVTEEQNILEIHAQLDVVAVQNRLYVDKMEDTDELVATESLSEFKDAISTEFLSEVSKEELESAKTDVDEVQITQPEETVKVETKDASDGLVELIYEASKLEFIYQAMVQDENCPLETYQEDAEPMTSDVKEDKSSLDKKEDAVNHLITEQSEIPEDRQIITTGGEIQKEELDTAVETFKEDTIQEDEAFNLPESAKIDQEATEKMIDVQTPEWATELEKEVMEELPDEAEPCALQEATETLKNAVEKISSAENKDDIECEQKLLETEQETKLKHELDNHEGRDEAVQNAKAQEEIVPSTDLVMQEQTVSDKAKDKPEEESSHQVSEVSNQANKQEESTIEQETKELQDDAVQEIATLEAGAATITSVEKIFEEGIIKKIVPSTEEEIKRQVIQHKATDEHKYSAGGLKEQPLQEAAKEELEENKLALEDSPDAQTGQVLTSTTNECETEVVYQLDQALNENHIDAIPLEGQAEQVDNSHDNAENIEKLAAIHVSSVVDITSIAQVCEDAINLEKAPETCLVTTKKLEHEEHIGEVEINLEGQMEDEIPCTETEVAEIEHSALLQETTCTPQNVMITLPDLVIKKTVEDGEKITEETSITCVDNAEILVEPKHEMHLSEVEQVDTHGKKEEEIVPPETSSVEIPIAVMAQITTCNFKDIALGIPEVCIMKTTEVNELMFGTVASEQEDKETIETITPLEVHNITEMAQESDTVVLMHVSSMQFEDNHRIQVEVVNVDVQSAETRVDTMLEVGMQESNAIVDVCYKTVDKVDTLSATSETEQEIVTEEDKVAIQEVVQHEKEAAPEIPKTVDKPEDKQSSAIAEVIISEEPETTIEIPDQELVVLTLHDSISPIKDKVISKIEEEMKEPLIQQQHAVQNQVATPSNAAVTVPQNRGIISSIGNVESPSSLSLEFKLNIQFGQMKAPILPTPPSSPQVSRSDPDKSREMSEVEEVVLPIKKDAQPQKPEIKTKLAEAVVQATEPFVQPVNSREMSEVEEGVLTTKKEDEPQKPEIETKLAEAAVQATEPFVQPDSAGTVVFKNEPVLIEFGIQSSKTEEPVKQAEMILTTNQSILTDVGIQSLDIAEAVDLTISTEMQETQKKPVVMDIGTQLAEKVEQVEKVKTTEITTTQNQPIVIETGIHSSELVKPTAEVKTTEVIIASIHAEEQIQTVKAMEKRELISTQQVVCEPVKQTEDEDDNQDVWMDAEEDIDGGPEETIVPLCDIEESFESQPEYFQETKAEFTESYDKICKMGHKCDIDSEDFAEPLEDPLRQTAIARVE